MTISPASFKRLIILFLICFILFGTAPQEAFAEEPSDIEDHWAKASIQTTIDHGLARGYPDGTFRPDNNITRAEFMSLVNGIFGYTEVAAISYSDVNKAEWYAYTISVAKAAGYISGYTDGTMRPDSPISREEVAIIIMKLNGLVAYPKATDVLIDSGLLEWSRGAVGSVLHAGIMNGYIDGSFGSQSFIKRGEGIVALGNAYAYSKNPMSLVSMTNVIKPIPGIATAPAIVVETPPVETNPETTTPAIDAKTPVNSPEDPAINPETPATDPEVPALSPEELAAIEAAKTITVGNSIELIATANNPDIYYINLNQDITLGATLNLNNHAKTIDLKGYHLIVAGNPIMVYGDDSKLVNGSITGAVIIGGDGKRFAVEDVKIAGALTTSNTNAIKDNMTFLNGSISLAITSTVPASLYDGTSLTAAIAPGSGTKFTNLTITGAVSASLPAEYDNVTFTGLSLQAVKRRGLQTVYSMEQSLIYLAQATIPVRLSMLL